ncbi:lipopolysaccharide heptosyltransferase RfaC [uncultured Neptuniibacter sp.]|uniref:lipopolysaccharide heptosyltransferase RfaC n=1 Tax=uncultured Neptuniibacter sp. TaxID=502143 RepID=UPI00262591E5|nr:lipopolysaccharide heptosyltransferase RfaC [uncultured Neptuniibacter sp.]
MRVLVVKTSSMGDVIHTLPALTDAMNAHPEIRFDWVVEEGFQEIPEWHPAVDQVIPVAIRRWRKNIIKTLRSGEWSAYKKQLTLNHYDAVIDAQGLLKSALLVTRLASGSSYGLDKHSAKEPFSAHFYDHPIGVAKQQHAVERVRQLFAQALKYPLPETRGDFAIRSHFLNPSEDASPYLVFQHSTTRFDKHWPEAYWSSLIEKAGAAGWQIKLPWGNPKERERAERLAAQHNFVEILPKLSIAEVASVLVNARACVSVDTGLSHLAAALDTPNFILFGPTDPGLVGGYGKDQTCLKSSDYPEIQAQIEPVVFAALTPEIVWNELTNFLNTR